MSKKQPTRGESLAKAIISEYKPRSVEALNVKVVVSNSSNFICASTDYAPDSTVCSKRAA